MAGFPPLTYSENKEFGNKITGKYESGVTLNMPELAIIQTEANYIITGYVAELDTTAIQKFQDPSWKFSEGIYSLFIKRKPSEYNGKVTEPTKNEAAICKYLDENYDTKYKDKFFSCEEFEIGGTATQKGVKSKFDELEEIEKDSLEHLKDFDFSKLLKAGSSSGGYNRGSSGVSLEKKVEFIISQLPDSMKESNPKTLYDVACKLGILETADPLEGLAIKHFYRLLGLAFTVQMGNIDMANDVITYESKADK